MSLATVRSRALDGIEAPPVHVEVHLANGLPTFTLVGLADTEVKESRERVRAALSHSGFAFPPLPACEGQACHTAELPYVFNSLVRLGCRRGGGAQLPHRDCLLPRARVHGAPPGAQGARVADVRGSADVPMLARDRESR